MVTRNAKVFGVSPYSQSKLDAVILWYGRVRPSRLASHLDKRPPSLSTTMPTAVEAQSRSSSRRTKKRRRVDVERGEATADAEAGSLPTAKRRKESMQPAAESELEEDGMGQSRKTRTSTIRLCTGAIADVRRGSKRGDGSGRGLSRQRPWFKFQEPSSANHRRDAHSTRSRVVRPRPCGRANRCINIYYICTSTLRTYTTDLAPHSY